MNDNTKNKATQDKATQNHFPCSQCGADLEYSPGIGELKCNYCGFINPIPESDQPILEHDFIESIQTLTQDRQQPLERKSINIVHCPSCAARFELHDNEHAGHCPFCDTPVVMDIQDAQLFHPESLLPFQTTEKQATESFSTWINSRWFAPSALKEKARRDDKLLGIYLPYWTYDSETDSDYRGERGTVYYVQENYTVEIDGKIEQRSRSVARIRWTAVSGQVRLFFDDVLIGATYTLPRTLLDPLQPWDLDQLKPYSEAYLSGFRSEIYQIELDEGFQRAQQVMNNRIRQAVKRDIGGDQQRISHVNTQHSDTTFKHILLPIWSAAFKYQTKTYRFVVNGCNGKVQGERPYSIIKIVAASIAAIALVGGLVYLAQITGLLEQTIQTTSYGRYR